MQFKPGWFFQVRLLTSRSFKNILRVPQALKVKIFVVVIIGIIMDLIYSGSDVNTSAGLENINGALFFVCLVITFMSINNIALLFPEERPVFLREVNNNMYCVTAYFFGKSLSELPSAFILPNLLAFIVYWVIGFSTVNGYSFPLFCKNLI